jgi:hypothetical protein
LKFLCLTSKFLGDKVVPNLRTFLSPLPFPFFLPYYLLMDKVELRRGGSYPSSSCSPSSANTSVKHSRNNNYQISNNNYNTNSNINQKNSHLASLTKSLDIYAKFSKACDSPHRVKPNEPFQVFQRAPTPLLPSLSSYSNIDSQLLVEAKDSLQNHNESSALQFESNPTIRRKSRNRTESAPSSYNFGGLDSARFVLIPAS